jgi:hypothetical protein
MKTELDTLIDAYLDGLISAPDMQRLNQRLNQDAEARRVFTEMLNLDSALAALAADHGPVSVKTPVFQPFRWRANTVVAALAACLALSVYVWWWQQPGRAYATVEKAAGIVDLAERGALLGERHSISAGSVSLRTERGARIVIEAPAEFWFESGQRLHLKRGRLAAEVPPPAKGFTVITPSGDAVDLGTRFGVDVPAAGAAEVHVFQGEVITQAAGDAPRRNLRGGDAVSLDRGTSTARDLRSAAFIQLDEMRELSAGLDAGQRARSEAALALLRQDPTLIALLDFEVPDSASLPGVFRSVQGRWPGSHAPEFVEVGDHLKLDVGGGRDWPQLTLAAWVRLDRLGEPYQSLLHTDGWESSNPGQVHWMITHHATMRLALRGNTLAAGFEEPGGNPDSLTPVLPEQGRWVHLAAVYDAPAKTVRFHLNGRLDREVRLNVAHPARLGPAQIGNWNRNDRRLSGRVDELVLLGRAMSAAEVGALHAAGSPYR